MTVAPRVALALAQSWQGVSPPPLESPASIVDLPLRDVVDRYDELVDSVDLRDATQGLFVDGYYALAVEEGFKCLNNYVKKKSGLANVDGTALMQTAFSLKNPRLRISDLKSQSKKDQQLGYMNIFAGSILGIRNPRAHEHRYLDEPAVALELLILANHLFRIADQSTRTRNRN